MNTSVDFLIVGGGIVGLSIARELLMRQPRSRICILEKEALLGKHASGRNSGVLHSGIFYALDSTKSKVCAQGGMELAAYCDEHRLTIERTGKVILPTRPEDEKVFNLLLDRAKKIGINSRIVDEKELKMLEPEAFSATGKAIHLPDVAVVEPAEILEQLARDLASKNVDIRFSQHITNVNPEKATLSSNNETISFGHLLNAAGLHADEVARSFGLAKKYTILPFKGLYHKISPSSRLKINGLIYALPDLRIPFLGIHFTKKANGEVYAGPTVVPALSRENYRGLENLRAPETFRIFLELIQLYVRNSQGFRKFVHKEGFRFIKRSFYEGAKRLVPGLKMEHLLECDKVGIRAQLVDTEEKELVMDFLMEKGERSTHVLNAVSPAFTSAFSFARLLLDEAGIR